MISCATGVLQEFHEGAWWRPRVLGDRHHAFRPPRTGAAEILALEGREVEEVGILAHLGAFREEGQG
jgi:hypothetical protein